MRNPIIALFALCVVAAHAQTTAVVQRTGIIAQSRFDFPVGQASPQGVYNWEYGFYDITLDGSNFTAFVTDGTTTPGSNNYWNGASFDYFGGNPPWTEITQVSTHPNGDNHVGSPSNHIQWTVRRYNVPDFSGGLGPTFPLAVNYTLRKGNTNCGNGVTGYVFHNGVWADEITILGSDGAGTNRTVNVTASAGDTIDLAVSPLGPDMSNNDGCDGTFYEAWISLNDSQRVENATLIADSQAEFSGVHGQDGWAYGYFETSNEVPQSAFIAFPSNYWNGAIWDWPLVNPPWTSVSALIGHPNGINSDPTNQHWAVRRYVVEPGEDGLILLNWYLAKANGAGNGVSIYVLVNGVQRDFRAIAGNESNGVRGAFMIPNATAGDTVDLALSSRGLNHNLNDGSDSAFWSAQLFRVVSQPTLKVSVTNGVDVDLFWQTFGATTALQRTENLFINAWTNVPGAVTPYRIPFTQAVDRAYYRLMTQ